MKRKETRIVFAWKDEVFEFRNVEIKEHIQDNGRTVKFFIKPNK